MNDSADVVDLAPDLKRFATALCGLETIGSSPAYEELMRRALQVTATSHPKPATASSLRVELYRTFYRLRTRAPIRSARGDGDLSSILQGMPLAHRASLMLIALEQFSYEDAAQVLGVSRQAFVELLLAARRMLDAISFQDTDKKLRVVQ